MNSEFIEINHKDFPKKNLKLSTIWLRDHCRCSQCFNHGTKQRLLELRDLSNGLSVDEIREMPGGKVLVLWSNGHESEYCFEWLWNSQVQNLKIQTPMKTWDRDSIIKENYAKLRVNDFLSSNDSVTQVVESLIRFGVAFIENVPPTTDMTEMVIRRIFPIMKTLFGEMFTFQDDPDHADTAYSKDGLGSHTDNTYFADAAGLQILHCVFHDGEGGESTLVDGLKCMEELRKTDTKAFDLLCKVHVPAVYIDEGKNQHHFHSAPILRLCPVTGELKQIRWNVYDRDVMNTIPQEKMPEFYDALLKLSKIIDDDKNRWVFKLNPGTVVFFNNWRLLHGRKSYTGLRRMTGSYVLRSEFLSKAKSLELM